MPAPAAARPAVLQCSRLPSPMGGRRVVTLLKVLRKRLQEPNRPLQTDDGAGSQGRSAGLDVSGPEAARQEGLQYEALRARRRPADDLHQRVEVHPARPEHEENQPESRRRGHNLLRNAGQNQVPGEKIQPDQDKVEQRSQLFAEDTQVQGFKEGRPADSRRNVQRRRRLHMSCGPLGC